MRFEDRRSLIHSLDPRAKLAAALALSSFIVLSSGAQALSSSAFVLALFPLASASVKAAAWEARWLFFPAALPLVFHALASDSAASGLVASFSLLGLLMVPVLLVKTTRPEQIASGLHWFGVPRRAALVFLLALRFVPGFQRGLQETRIAQACRGASRRNPFSSALPSLHSAFRAARSLSVSLEARGFEEERFLPPCRPFSGRDAVAVSVFLFFLLIFYNLKP